MNSSFSTDIHPHYLYIHWPFCKNKCHYCDFVAFEKHEGFERDYHRALCAEISAFVAERPASAASPITTIFIGGGTPSLYPLPLFKELFGLLREKYDLSQMQECSMEVNPGGLTEEHFKIWRDAGINRLSIGVQILDDKVLYALNRRQTAQEAVETVTMAAQFFDNLSVDLILGLPGASDESWQRTLEAAVVWPIKHISIYFLTVHEQTPLYYRLRRGELSLKPDDAMVVGYKDSIAFLKQHGFNQYEISNFARPGFESIHNQAYWNRYPYKGFGIGAASFDGTTRSVNEKGLTKYINHWLHGMIDDLHVGKGSPFVEKLTDQQQFIEFLMLGLRQNKGMARFRIMESCLPDRVGELMRNIERMKDAGYLQEIDGVISFTQEGMILENSVVQELF